MKRILILNLFLLLFLAACANEAAPSAENQADAGQTTNQAAVATGESDANANNEVEDVSLVDEAPTTAEVEAEEADPEAANPNADLEAPAPIEVAPPPGAETTSANGNGAAQNGTVGEEALADIEATALSDAERASLLFMREEEKLAHDVYMALYAQWGLAIFQNIANSELAHMESVRTLLVRYDLDDPAAGKPDGLFVNEDLQLLYDQLVADGGVSLESALRVGALIEEVDIIDLETGIAQSDNEDIKLVYGQLLAGSYNHLRAFVNNLGRQTDLAYAPQLLDQAAYDAIVGSTNGRGQGPGRGGQSGSAG